MKTEVDFDEVIKDFIDDVSRHSYSNDRRNESLAEQASKLIGAFGDYPSAVAFLTAEIGKLPAQWQADICDAINGEPA